MPRGRSGRDNTRDIAITQRLKWYLDHHGVAYEVVPHPRTESSLETARAAHVDEGHLVRLASAVRSTLGRLRNVGLLV